MLLGKRPRHRIRRTTSVTSITVVDLEVDDDDDDAQDPSGARQNPLGESGPPRAAAAPDHPYAGEGGENIRMAGGFGGPYDPQSSFLALVSPRNYGNMEAEGAHFLNTCGLCKRRLFPGRDIYMYRGDTAFCSLECREQQMKQDEKKEKHSNPNSRRQGRKASPV
ncbi:hypothetical protein BT93_H3829 [Corymbia citriodora subsp. variegata]|nr:hypothetical protein BT93_H3829 [Corymbia citriodora subsp. variegata]